MVETLLDRGRSALDPTPDPKANRRWSQLLPPLPRLDARLAQAVHQARAAYVQARAGEQFRGLYVGNAALLESTQAYEHKRARRWRRV